MTTYYGPRGSECTATLRRGQFCSAPAMEGLPFPLCTRHAIQVHLAMTGMVKSKLGINAETLAVAESERTLRTAERKAGEVSQVYYLDMPYGKVKIGYTVNLVQRCSALRVDRSSLLATEPGGRQMERVRHRQFASIRDGQREDFDRTPDLLAHVERIRAEFGPPIITGR